MIELGLGGLLLLVIGGFVARTVLGPGEGTVVAAMSPSASASASPTAASSIDPTPTATAAPSPTPVPTPAGPPQEIAVGAWATVVVDELNVRDAAGTDATSRNVLVRGAVMHVAEGPALVAGLNWYRIASLGGAVGWVTSGWVAEPFMTTLVEDPTLIRCGEVQRPVFDVVDGQAKPHEPIEIGDMALPATAFSNLSLGAMELLRGVGGEACFSAQIGSDGLPAIRAQLTVNACGHAVADGDLFRLRPAAGQGVPVEAQVKDPAVVHPDILVGGPPEDRQSSNLRSIVSMMAAGAEATGCIHLNVTEDDSGLEAYRSVDTTQCSIVHEYNVDTIRLSPAAGGDIVWIKLSRQGSAPGVFPLDVPVAVGVTANSHDGGRDAYAHQTGDTDCA
jgi:hypothetical protein